MEGRKPGVRSSLVLSFAQSATSFALTLPTIIIVSHLLTPTEVGIYSLGVTVVNLIHMLRDFGVSEYLIQELNLTDATARTAFTITLGIAWLLAILLFVISAWIGGFYRDAGVTEVLRILCINFLLLPFGTTVTMLLRRDMQFGTLYKIGTTQQLAQSVVTILLTFMGLGYVGLAWGSVAGISASVLGCLTWGRRHRIKGLGLTDYRRVVRFGVTRTLGDIVVRLGQGAPDFVIGRVLSLGDVGLYSRGHGLVNMYQQNVINSIGAVAFPVFAQQHRDYNNAYRMFLKSLAYVTGISWPFFTVAALMASPIIRIMFGTQWAGAVPILQLLSIAAIAHTLTYQCDAYFTGVGRVGIATRTEATVQTFGVLLLVATAFVNLEAVAASRIVVYLLAIVVYYHFLLNTAQIGVSDIVRTVVPSLYVTGTSAIVPAISYALLVRPGSHEWLAIVVSALGGLAGWCAGIYIFRHPLYDEVGLLISRFRRKLT